MPSNKQHDVFGIGNALVDILVHVSDAFLSQVQQATTAFPVHKGSMHLVGTEFQGHLLRLLEPYELHTVSGGSAANTMFGVAQLGSQACYAGKVGNDVYGAFYADDMQSMGVHFPVPRGSMTTGTCIILMTPDAQRTMFTNLGISIELTASDIDAAAIRDSRWLYIEGYLWDPPSPRAASIKAMEIAKAAGVKIAYSFSDAFCVQRARDDFRSFTREYVDLVFCNEPEALAFSQTDCVHEALTDIETLGTNIALTLGAAGSILSFHGERYQIPAQSVPAIDTTGAGDLYAAGVLHGLCHGFPIAKAGALGADLGAQIVSISGARLPRTTATL